MKTLTIKRKMSNTGSIHDLASDMHDRDIEFRAGCKYAVVLASYYGGKGYTTHQTADAAVAASRKMSEYSHTIIDSDCNAYSIGPNDMLVQM